MQTYPTGYAESHRMAEQIFREILPRHGMAVREEQIALCHEVLDTLYNKEISLCEAGVGTGKTLAYLVACILWQMHRPDKLKMPIVISTASVALQEAILTEYLPELSDVLLQEGVIRTPIQAVIRKGKERFACQVRLSERQAETMHRGRFSDRQRSTLRMAENTLDLDHIPRLSHYDRCSICVPKSCPPHCFMRAKCRYLQYLRDAKDPRIQIQICNHNYLLADATHRLEERPRLLRPYQALVVDEAHKLLNAARQMYADSLSPRMMRQLYKALNAEGFLLFSARLHTDFDALCKVFASDLRKRHYTEFSPERYQYKIMRRCAKSVHEVRKAIASAPAWIFNQLEETENVLNLFLLNVPTRILYIEYDIEGRPTFCASSNRVPQLLHDALWRWHEPAILTSGTLTASGDFSHTEQVMGLEEHSPLRHFHADSPFNYRKNCLLYFPKRRRYTGETAYLAEQITHLVAACHGHALVLFTSYRQMRNVYDALDGRLTFPVFQAGRGQNRSIQQFKQSGNGVLFAAGSCWEGIDFPGDMVSLLIIAKLPFPFPDPVSDYERKQYPNLRDYINAEIIPEMQKKLRQGFGRAIRTEQDSCVVAILDERAGIGGKYHDAALAALPTCPVTEKIEDVQQFIREQKRPDYFL